MTAPYQCVSLAQLNLTADTWSQQSSPGIYSPGSDSTFTEWNLAHRGSREGLKVAYITPPESSDGASTYESEEDIGNGHIAAGVRRWMKTSRPSQHHTSQVKKIRVPVRRVCVSSDLNVRTRRPKDSIPSSSKYRPFSDILSSATLTDNERHLLEELMPENMGDNLSIDTTGETGFEARRSNACREHQPSSTWLKPQFEPGRRTSATWKTWRFEADKHQTKLQGKTR